MLYEDRVAQFRWQVPDEFNFAWDVVDAYAEDRSRLALVWENEAGEEARYSFWDVGEGSRRFANVLRALGIGRGDPVMIMLPRIPEWQIAFLGALRLGALVIPCTGQLRARDIAYRANHSEAKAIVTTADNRDVVDAVTASASGLDPYISPQNAAIQVDRVAAARHVSPAAIAALVKQYTKGRTLGFLGEPRVTVLTLNIALDERYPAR
jgi:acetyl-CoA synthetase